MAGFNYGRSKATADRLIDRFGKGAFLRKVASTTPTDPWNPPAASASDYALRVVELEYSQYERSNSLIMQNDKKFLVAVGKLVVEPESGDKLVVVQNVYDIISVKPLQPGEVTILYELQVR